MPDELELLIQQIKNDVGEEKYNLLYKKRFEKYCKAIRIIKKKRVDVGSLMYIIEEYAEELQLEKYNRYNEYSLSINDFKILKEVFCK